MDVISAAGDAFRAGRPTLFVNEIRGIGVVGLPIEIATTAWVNWLIVYCKGILYAALPESRLEQLQIPRHPHSGSGSQYHYVAVDARGTVTTGISAEDRTQTIWALAYAEPAVDQFTMPGHVTPRGLLPTGVLGRVGLAEAIQDVATACGFDRGVVFCGVLTEEGEDANRPWLKCFAEEHGLPEVEISDVIRFRRSSEGWSIPARTTLELPYFDATALVAAPEQGAQLTPLNVTVRRVCVAGDVLGDCSCTAQRPSPSELASTEDRWAHMAIWPDRELPTCGFAVPDSLAPALARIVAADHCATVPEQVILY